MKQKEKSMISGIMFSYCLTFMMVELVDTASIVVDGIIVSRGLDASALAATGLAAPVFQLMSLFCGVIATGTQIKCSQYMGAGDQKKTDAAFSFCVSVSALIAAVVTAGGLLLLPYICRLFGARDPGSEIFGNLSGYLRGVFLGAPGFIGYAVLSPLVALDGNKKRVTAAMLTQSSINIIGDILSVTVLHAGTFGVGLSTAIGFYAALFLLIRNFRGERTAFHLQKGKPDPAIPKDIVKIGLPRLTRFACKLASPVLLNNIIMTIGGVAAMAAMSVKSGIADFCLVAGTGISQSVNLLSQVFSSEKDKDSLRETAAGALRLILFLCAPVACAVFFGAGFLTKLYLTPGTEEFRLTVFMFRCFSFSVILNAVNQSVLSFLQGTRQLRAVHSLTIFHKLVSVVLTALLLGKIFGIEGLFLAIPGAEVLTLLWYVAGSLWKRGEKSLPDALLRLPSDFGYAPEDQMALNPRTVEEVTGISEQINRFCLEHGIDARRSYYAALCIEEMAVNVLKHGFNSDKKEHSCAIHVMIENNDVVIRIRDDCQYFNLKERYETMQQGDIFSNVGIRLVYGIAKEVNYVNLLNTNTVILRV